MTARVTRFATALLGAALAATLLSGCAANPGTENHGMNHSTDTESSYSADDIMFLQMMIPHHQQAVEMGTLAETRASNPEVKALAAAIKAEQDPEIAQMTIWLGAAGASEHMGHSMTMDGMLTDEQMQELANASGAEFDRLFVEGMILHHEGAIEMAKSILNSKSPNIKALGEAITASQTEQIALMKELLGKL